MYICIYINTSIYIYMYIVQSCCYCLRPAMEPFLISRFLFQQTRIQAALWHHRRLSGHAQWSDPLARVPLEHGRAAERRVSAVLIILQSNSTVVPRYICHALALLCFFFAVRASVRTINELSMRSGISAPWTNILCTRRVLSTRCPSMLVVSLSTT